MGVDAGDFDGNGTEDIFVTHLMEETNTLYVNLGQGLFEDRTRENGLAIPGVSYLEAMRWRGPALAAYVAAVAGVDAVIAPVAPVAAPTIAESDVGNSDGAEAVIQRLTRFTRPVNYLGLPSLSIPAGFTRNGLPVGRQLIGRSFDEAMLLRLGAAFQRATDFHARVPKPA